eukprot:2377413-Amphidinium_carterae.1
MDTDSDDIIERFSCLQCPKNQQHHVHTPVEGKYTTRTGHYPVMFAQLLHQAIRHQAEGRQG